MGTPFYLPFRGTLFERTIYTLPRSVRDELRFLG
jgi:hypothetical protein